MDRTERRARIKALSATAMALIRQHGDRGNVDLAADRARSSEWRYNEFRIALLRYADPTVPSLLEVYHDGAKVMIVEWTVDKSFARRSSRASKRAGLTTWQACRRP